MRTPYLTLIHAVVTAFLDGSIVLDHFYYGGPGLSG